MKSTWWFALILGSIVGGCCRRSRDTLAGYCLGFFGNTSKSTSKEARDELLRKELTEASRRRDRLKAYVDQARTKDPNDKTFDIAINAGHEDGDTCSNAVAKAFEERSIAARILAS